MLPHSDIVDLLRLTLLIYNYDKEFKLEDDNNDIEGFISKMVKNDEFDNLQINDNRKQVLKDLANNVPSAKLVKYFNNKETDLQCGVSISEEKKRICIIFRGSESITDWKHDLQITKHLLNEDTNIKVHSGFYNQLMSVYEELLDCVIEHIKKHKDYDIYVSGHSLGGALCTLFGYMLSENTENMVNVVSFASPRVGNYNWKNDFNNKKNLLHYRVTNKRDIVTAFPLYRYYHVGQHICLHSDTFKNFGIDYVKSWYEETFFTCWSASEHDCELYYKRIQDNVW
jgi:triacylglycerol lipase|tara:strand:- start:17319 stop:18170 length:852 start_codon:yes stop_codon:yes gene_type:complete